jgi:hypothetical protein
MGNSFTYGYNGMGRSCPMGQTCDCAAMSRTDDRRAVDDRFLSITGLVNFAFGDLRLEPRGDADLVRRAL